MDDVKLNEIVQIAAQMEDTINKIIYKINFEEMSKKERIDSKNTLTEFIKRNKKIKSKINQKKVNYRNLKMTHENTLYGIPFLKERIDELEKELIEYNKQISIISNSNKLIEFEKKDILGYPVIIAGENSRHVESTITKGHFVTVGIKNAFMGEQSVDYYINLLPEYIETCKRLSHTNRILVGIYDSINAKLTTHDLAFMIIPPSTRDSLAKYQRELNLSI